MQFPLLAPVAALMALTATVWTRMAVQRVRYIVRHRIHPQRVCTQEQIAELLPESINRSASNFRNLCELPVVFYATCLALALLKVDDTPTAALAWSFVAGRVVHSAIQCTVNIVIWRFYLYIASSLLLWALVARLFWALR